MASTHGTAMTGGAAGAATGAGGPGGMDPVRLLQEVERVLKLYNPATTTLDAHVLDTLGEIKEDDDDKVFIQQAFYGCVRYKKFLKVFCSSFYFNNSAMIQRSDYTMYMVLCYLAVFRLEEMGWNKFKYILSFIEPAKVHHFLAYLFNLHNINVWLKDEWAKVLDRTYLEETIIGNIKKRLPTIKSYLEANYERAFGTVAPPGGGHDGMDETGGSPPRSRPETAGSAEDGEDDEEGRHTRKSPSRRTVTFNPPNLTQPRPRVAPEPMKIEQTAKANPVPKHLNRTTLADIERQRQEQAERTKKTVMERYTQPDAQPFKLHETRTNVEHVRAEVESKRQAELQFDSFRAKPAPVFDTPAQVKLNAAAIMREDALLRKKQEQDAALIKAYEADLRDSTEYYRWQSDMRSLDDELKRQQVERRRLEMAASQQEAVEASERKRLENRQLADAIKVEKQAALLAAEDEERARLENMRALVEEVKEVRERAPREAVEAVLQSKVAAREALNEELAELRARAEEERRIEQERKDDLIRQIRALEMVPKQRVKIFDPTESSGVGLLEEMSLVELRERLALAKAQAAEEEADRRNLILKEKRDKELDLRRRIGNIQKVRESAADANRAARERRKQLEAEKAAAEQAERDRGNLEVAERIIAKRRAREAEEQRLREEQERIAKQRMFLGAAKSAIEERHFEQQALGAEREAKQRQEVAKAEAAVYEQVKETAVKTRHRVQRAERAAEQALDAQREQQLEAQRRRAQSAAMETQKEKKAKVKDEQARHEATLRARDSLNPYAATKSLEHKTLARETMALRTGTLRTTGSATGLPQSQSARDNSSEIHSWADMG